MTLQTTNGITLNSNVLWIGSGTVNANGKYSNINMLDAGGQNWETQSSAFTDTIKQNIVTMSDKFLNASIFGQNTGKISITKNFEFIGRASGTTTLANNTVYNNTFDFNVGLDLNSYGPNLFGSDGKFQSGIGSMNFTMYFEMAFTCKNSTIRQLKSSIIVKNTSDTNIDNSYTQGIHYRTAQTFNEFIMVLYH